MMEQPPEGNPAIGCDPPPDPPCVMPSPPSLVGTALAEEVEMSATIPANYPAVVVWWRIQEELGPPTYQIATLYETKSVEAVTNQSGNTVSVGLPGLRRGAEHLVSVAFCQDIAGYPGLKGCNCWSGVTRVTTAQNFTADTPDEPPRPNMNLQVEDHFRRPPTTKQTTPVQGEGGGDGVGPDAVWEDGFDPPTPEGSYIASDEDTAVVSNGLLRYVRPAKHTDSFAATRFWITDAVTGGTSNNYNIEIAARHVGSGAGTQFYAAKLVWNQLGVNDFPLLGVLDETQIDPLTGAIDPAALTEGVDFIKLTKPGTVATCPGMSADKCTALPPLTSGTDRVANSVVLQISAYKDQDRSKTVITAAIGWSCGSAPNTSLYECGKVCCLAKTDSDPSKLDILGRWFLFGHHSTVNYNLEWFRAGDASTGPWP